MKRRRKRKSRLGLVILLLCILLAGVIAVIVYKQVEYSVSADYYNSLRVGLLAGGMCA